MNVLFLIGALSLLAFANGMPKPQNNIVTGVFIPADVLKNLQDRANANSPQTATNQIYQPNTNVQNPQVISTVQNPQPATSQVYVPSTNVQTAPSNGQSAQIAVQPVYTNQPQYQTVVAAPAQTTNQVQPTVVGRLGEVTSNQPLQQTSQPTQSVIYVQQPQQTQQTILVPQSSQPAQQTILVPQNSQPTQQTILVPQNSQPGQQTILVPQNSQSGQQTILVPQNSQPSQQTILVPQTSQPSQQTILVPQTSQPTQQTYVSQPSNQGIVVQNEQPNQPAKVIFANPSGNQAQSQNSNPVYTLIPLSGQNFNLVPVQSGSNPVVVSSG